MDAVKFVRQVIDEICDDMAKGHEVKYESVDAELRWVWTNVQTKKQWTFNIRVFKRLVDQSHGDPRVPAFCALVGNRMTVPEVQAEMRRLENLKAFW